MINSETDLLFPLRVIPALCAERGPVWQELVATVEQSAADSVDHTAFILLMARMNSCATCNSDSFRAMNGCVICSRQSLKRFRGTDDDLTRTFETAKIEVKHFLINKV